MAHTKESLAAMTLPDFMLLAEKVLGSDQTCSVLAANDLRRSALEEAVLEEQQKLDPHAGQKA